VFVVVSPAGTGRLAGVHVVPERVSAKSEPTATQEVAEVHETPLSCTLQFVVVYPDGNGRLAGFM